MKNQSTQLIGQFATIDPVVQTSTSAETVVAGSLIDSAGTVGNVTYRVKELGGTNGVQFNIQGSLDGVAWDSVEGPGVSAAGTSSALTYGPTYALAEAIISQATLPLYRYYQLTILDQNSGSHGVAQVTGYCA